MGQVLQFRRPPYVTDPVEDDGIKKRKWLPLKLKNGKIVYFGEPFRGQSVCYTNFVEDVGTTDAEIMLIGEAPGRNENFWRLGRDQNGPLRPTPFVGWSGRILQEWWREVDLYRRQFYITNVFPYWPPFKDRSINQIVSKDELFAFGERLHDKIRRMKNLRLIVPTGNTALYALTGKRNISNWRGSILAYHSRDGRTIKVIPTLHPAGVARDPGLERRCKLDWARISADFDFKQLRLPKRNHIIPSDDVEAFKKIATAWKTKALSGEFRYLVHDVETAGGKVTCVGYAISKDESITVPYQDIGFWKTRSNMRWAHAFHKEMLESELEKIGQNEGYDTFWYIFNGIKIRKRYWCTLAMHHCLDSSDEHSLEYMASVETREPFWKKEGKEGGLLKDITKIKDRKAYYTYNGKDCCTEFEIFEILKDRLDNIHKTDEYTAEVLKEQNYKNLTQFYINHYRHMFAPLMSMTMHGVNVNDKERRRRLSFLRAEMIDIEDRLEALAGEKLHSKKILSAKKVADFLFNKLKLPVTLLTKNDEPSTNVIAVRGLFLKYQGKIEKAREQLASSRTMRPKTRIKVTADIADWQMSCQALELIMRFRKAYQTSTFYGEKRVDTDGRMRCTFTFNTEFGRLSSRRAPNGTGANLQNQQHGKASEAGSNIRDIFIPDEGCYFIEPDLSQAESRAVGMYSQDKELIRMARTLPWEFDVHTFNAAIVFNMEEALITKELRELGKRAVHASNYLMQGFTLSEILLKEYGIIRTPQECQLMIDAYLNAMPGVRAYHESTIWEARRYRRLTNNWGRIYHFEHYRVNNELDRVACASRPQGDVADLLNQWGLIPAHKEVRKLRSAGYAFALHQQVHDSLLASAPIAAPKQGWEFMKFIRESLERPRNYYGEDLCMPVGFKIGFTGAFGAGPLHDAAEFKKFPTFKEYRDALAEMIEKHNKGTGKQLEAA